MYKICLSNQARKFLRKLSQKEQKQLNEKLSALAKKPFANFFDIKKLQGTEKEYRLRVGDLRITYELINDILVINVLKIMHRKEVYR